MHFVYILKGSRYYVGYTSNLTLRINQHREGKTPSTSKYGDLEFIGYFQFENKIEATNMEAKIKRSKNIKRWIGSEGFKFN